MTDARIMGIVNVTPDSFSDGGDFLDPERAIAHGRELAAEGADVLDVGGESTRPGAEAVGAEEELHRVQPVIEALAGAGTEVSIDTSKVAVAEAALDAGAAMVNDVTALRAEPELAGLCAERDCEVVLMHMLGEPRTMQENPTYDDVVDDVKAFLAERIEFATSEGIDEERIWIDPGIGFGKTVEHNLELHRRLGELAELGRPIAFGILAQELHRQAHRGRGRSAARRHDRLQRDRLRERRPHAARPRRRADAPGAHRGRRDPGSGPRVNGLRPPLADRLSTNSRISALTSSGRSYGTQWPAPGMISTRRRGTHSLSPRVSEGSSAASFSPQITRVGTSTVCEVILVAYSSGTPPAATCSPMRAAR